MFLSLTNIIDANHCGCLTRKVGVWSPRDNAAVKHLGFVFPDGHRGVTLERPRKIQEWCCLVLLLIKHDV